MDDETEDIAAQPTITFWGWQVPPAVERTVGRTMAPLVARIGCGPLVALVVAAVLVVTVAYAAGYASGNQSQHWTTYGYTRAGVAPTVTPSPWHVVWHHSGHGREMVTPPALSTRDTPRFLLAWNCGASKNAASITVNLSQPPDVTSDVSLGSIRCPGYSSVQLTVGQDTAAHALGYGAYGVLVDASGDASWVVTVSEWQV